MACPLKGLCGNPFFHPILNPPYYQDGLPVIRALCLELKLLLMQKFDYPEAYPLKAALSFTDLLSNSVLLKKNLKIYLCPAFNDYPL